MVQRLGDVRRNPDRLIDRKLFLPLDPLPERLSLHEGHDVEQERVGLTRVEERKDMRVLQVSGGLDLREEPLRTDYRSQLWP